MSSTIVVPSSLVDQACAVAAQQGWYKVEASYSLPCGSRASIVGWRPNATPTHPTAPQRAARAPQEFSQATCTDAATQTDSVTADLPKVPSKAQKKRDRKKRSIANLHESRHDNPAEMRSVAQIELTRSNARELEPVPDAIERAAIVERAPVRDPGRPTSPEAERLEPEPDLAAHSKRPRLDRPQPTSQVGERDEVGARIVEMLEELFHDECAGGCDCEECDPEEEGHEDDCDCGGCGPAGSWAFRRGQHVAQLRAARAAGLARWRDAATGMRA